MFLENTVRAVGAAKGREFGMAKSIHLHVLLIILHSEFSIRFCDTRLSSCFRYKQV